MKVIGLSGYARSGKDTLADILVDRHGYTKVAFADKMRDFLYAQNPPVIGWDYDGYGKKIRLVEPLREVVDQFGWDGYKSSPFGGYMRELVQRTGTEAGRQTLWEDIWVDAAFKNLDPDGKYVFADARFVNEADAVADRGGLLLRINRPGVGPAVDSNGVAHPSETSLDDYDKFNYIVDNKGSIEELSQYLDLLLFAANGTGRFPY